MKATAPIPHGSGLSDEDGLKVVQQERDNLDLIADIIDKEGWTQEVDFWKGELCEGEQMIVNLERPDLIRYSTS
jgi:hypothetical protein